MRKTVFCLIIITTASCLSSCGLARGLGQTMQRTMQSVGRTMR